MKTQTFEKAKKIAEDGCRGRMKSEWISVKDRLPGNVERVLVCCQDSIGSLWFDVILFDGCWWGGLGQITHWMPLPEPPAEKTSAYEDQVN